MSDWGSACGPNCGWCGACTSGPPMIRCAQCGQLMPEPDECVIEPLCEGCVYNNQHQGQNEQWEDE